MVDPATDKMGGHARDQPVAVAQRKPGALEGVTELIRAVGGALLAFVAVLALVILTWAKLDSLAQPARGEAFVAVIGAISTIVGGYIGLKIGATGTDTAQQSQKSAEKAKDVAEKSKDAAKSDVAVLLGKLTKDEADTARNQLKSL